MANKVRLEDCYLQYLLDEATNTEIELTINDEKQDYTNGSAFGHFAFSVESFDKFTEKLHSLGYEYLYEPYTIFSGTKIAFVKE